MAVGSVFVLYINSSEPWRIPTSLTFKKLSFHGSPLDENDLGDWEPTQKFSEFQCGTVTGCHLCSKSSCEIFSLLNIVLLNKIIVSRCLPPFCRGIDYRSPNFMWPSDYLTNSFKEWLSVAESCIQPNTTQSGLKGTATGLQSNGDMSSGVVNYLFPPGNPMEVSGFGSCQENDTCVTV